MKEKIANKLWKMWLFREEAKTGSEIYIIRNSRLSGAIDLIKAIGFNVEFNPLANENENPFIVEEIK